MSQVLIAFGQNVKVRDTPVTRTRSLAGLSGRAFGYTIPSITRVDVVGELSSDIAIHIHLQGGDDFWFAPELLEFIDAGVGTTPKVGAGSPWWKFW
jgi:hypothetical protein